MEDKSPKWRLIDKFLNRAMSADEQRSFHDSVQADDDLRQGLEIKDALRKRRQAQMDMAYRATHRLRRRRRAQRWWLAGVVVLLSLILLVWLLLEQG